MKRIGLLLLLCLPLAAHADVEAGKRKAAACAACHGADGNSTDPAFPVLAQQTARYLYLQLKDFKEGRRKDPLMSPMAEPLSKEECSPRKYFAAQSEAEWLQRAEKGSWGARGRCALFDVPPG
jgi:cytochrome c553